ERGHEYGTTTGRRGRVGWFDAVPLRDAVAVDRVSAVMLNKLDSLSVIPALRPRVAYEIDGGRGEPGPPSPRLRSRARPDDPTVPYQFRGAGGDRPRGAACRGRRRRPARSGDRDLRAFGGGGTDRILKRFLPRDRGGRRHSDGRLTHVRGARAGARLRGRSGRGRA